jgi:hypothetical protein
MITARIPLHPAALMQPAVGPGSAPAELLLLQQHCWHKIPPACGFALLHPDPLVLTALLCTQADPDDALQPGKLLGCLSCLLMLCMQQLQIAAVVHVPAGAVDMIMMHNLPPFPQVL